VKQRPLPSMADFHLGVCACASSPPLVFTGGLITAASVRRSGGKRG
jgi:hypothetical protein